MRHAPILVAVALAACSGGGRYHPSNFNMGAVHGPALKQQAEDCRTCHGTDLKGGDSPDNGPAPSCDGCHTGATPTAWRTNCTYCHGGVENDTGAPPRNLDGTDQVGPFPVHTIHVTGSALAVPFDCDQCHTKAIDVLSPGHVFDSTPGVAENDYGNGLAPQTVYTLADRTCANNYCHGNGRGDTGKVAAQAGQMACNSCHAVAASPASDFVAMSGGHASHLGGAIGATCNDCHHATTTDGATIADRTRHVNGVRDVVFGVAGMTYDAATQTCSGTCHGYSHLGIGWGSSGTGADPHPPGFAAPSMHGPEMELQRQDCRGCHGADLTGGTGPSCDSCHQANWRTNCTYCHGGGLDQTGAPPRDLGSTILNTAQSFVAHPKHVEASATHVAFDCTQCHAKPTDVMSVNHAFDATPGKAENVFTAGLAPATTYDGAGTCANNYCHGNGRTNGTYKDGSGPLTCGGCHAGMASGSTGWSTMSGSHRKHLGMGYTCGECHQTVASADGTAIIAANLHVDGQKQVSMKTTTITYDPATKRCTGACHGENHNTTW